MNNLTDWLLFAVLPAAIAGLLVWCILWGIAEWVPL